eukprot:1327228-Pleurochrysis_carterae.AAC.1
MHACHACGDAPHDAYARQLPTVCAGLRVHACLCVCTHARSIRKRLRSARPNRNFINHASERPPNAERVAKRTSAKPAHGNFVKDVRESGRG